MRGSMRAHSASLKSVSSAGDRGYAAAEWLGSTSRFRRRLRHPPGITLAPATQPLFGPGSEGNLQGKTIGDTSSTHGQSFRAGGDRSYVNGNNLACCGRTLAPFNLCLSCCLLIFLSLTK